MVGGAPGPSLARHPPLQLGRSRLRAGEPAAWRRGGRRLWRQLCGRGGFVPGGGRDGGGWAEAGGFSRHGGRRRGSDGPAVVMGACDGFGWARGGGTEGEEEAVGSRRLRFCLAEQKARRAWAGLERSRRASPGPAGTGAARHLLAGMLQQAGSVGLTGGCVKEESSRPVSPRPPTPTAASCAAPACTAVAAYGGGPPALPALIPTRRIPPQDIRIAKRTLPHNLAQPGNPGWEVLALLNRPAASIAVHRSQIHC